VSGEFSVVAFLMRSLSSCQPKITLNGQLSNILKRMRVGKRERKLTENMKKVSWKQTDAFFCVKVGDRYV